MQMNPQCGRFPDEDKAMSVPCHLLDALHPNWLSDLRGTIQTGKDLRQFPLPTDSSEIVSTHN